MLESLLIVIVLLSLVYPYFRLDMEQDEIAKPCRSSKKLNELKLRFNFAQFG